MRYHLLINISQRTQCLTDFFYVEPSGKRIPMNIKKI